MREILKTLSQDDYWVYGINEGELDYTISLVEGFQQASDEALEMRLANTDFGDLDEDTIGEITSDHRYYNWIGKAYLWSFALWRMQGILESMIVSKFLPKTQPKKLIGLKSKLDAMKSAAYSLADSDEAELISWGNLRNLFSHMPPEQFRPVHLDREDIDEYKVLVQKVCGVWNAEYHRNNPG